MQLGRRIGGELCACARALTIALMLCVVTAIAYAAPALREVTQFGSNPGNLRMFEFVPPSLPATAPLVVALHGCGQRASDYADNSGWITLAQRFGFALLLPEQKPDNNTLRCFNWFNGWAPSDFWTWSEWGSDQDRDEGEALSIAQMIDKISAEHSIDRQKIFVTGLSGGGAMTAVMLATYPERFAAGAILAGVPYKCARNGVEAVTQCGLDLNRAGAGVITDLTPTAWALRVRNATRYTGPWPRVSIWQGSADKTVNPADARELVEQWTAVHGIDPGAADEDQVKGFPHRTFRDTKGVAQVEMYLITGMNHGVPVNPGNSNDQCGRTAEYFFAVGICSSYYIAKFWGLTP